MKKNKLEYQIGNNPWTTLKFNSRPHDVFKLNWSSYNSLEFADTFLPYINNNYTGKAIWMYDGAELFQDIKKTTQKLFKFKSNKNLICLINYSYPKGVLAENKKNTVQVTENEILTFIEINEYDQIEVSFKFGHEFKRLIQMYLIEKGEIKTVDDFEKKIYKSNKETFLKFFNKRVEHYKMMKYILSILDLKIESFSNEKYDNENITVTNDEPYVHKDCSSKISIEEIEKLLVTLNKKTKRRLNNAKNVLPYINKYRDAYKLDSCLRKSHFFAHVLVESNYFHTFSEDGHYRSTNSIPGVFSKNEKIVDELILSSLFENLNEIFEFRDKSDKIITKTNKEIKSIILTEKIIESDKKLYAKFIGVKDGENRKKKLLKEVKEKVNISGNEVVQIKYKIYLKIHKAFEKPLLSRAYAPYPGDRRGTGNGNEYSRDGWKYKGRGLKQVTGRYNYTLFTAFRNNNPFPNDETGKIDFTDKENKNAKSIEGKLDGNYLKLSNNMYATQSAFWYWCDKKYNKKNCYQYADSDNIYYSTKAINGSTAGLEARKKALLVTRKVFKVYDYYRETFKNGTIEQKIAVQKNIESIAFTRKYSKNTIEGDPEAREILKEINKPITLKTKGTSNNRHQNLIK